MVELKINLTTELIERMRGIVNQAEIFENCEDFVLHATIDMLERYSNNKP